MSVVEATFCKFMGTQPSYLQWDRKWVVVCLLRGTRLRVKA